MKHERALFGLAVIALLIFVWYRRGGRLAKGSLWPWSVPSLSVPSVSAPLNVD